MYYFSLLEEYDTHVHWTVASPQVALASKRQTTVHLCRSLQAATNSTLFMRYVIAQQCLVYHLLQPGYFGHSINVYLQHQYHNTQQNRANSSQLYLGGCHSGISICTTEFFFSSVFFVVAIDKHNWIKTKFKQTANGFETIRCH